MSTPDPAPYREGPPLYTTKQPKRTARAETYQNGRKTHKRNGRIAHIYSIVRPICVFWPFLGRITDLMLFWYRTAF